MRNERERVKDRKRQIGHEWTVKLKKKLCKGKNNVRTDD